MTLVGRIAKRIGRTEAFWQNEPNSLSKIRRQGCETHKGVAISSQLRKGGQNRA